MKILRQSTAGQEIPIGYLVDSGDGDTEEVSLTINAADIVLHKTGGTTFPAKNSGGATHVQNGLYYATLDDTDTDTLGPLHIHVHVAGALAFRDCYTVVTSARYDVMTGTTAAVATVWEIVFT